MAEKSIIECKNIKYPDNAGSQNIFLREMSLEEYDKRIISEYLQKYNNNVLLVAKKLNIGKSTIYRMLK